MRSVEQLAQSTNPSLVRAFGAIRRFVITLTDTAIWQIAGVLMPDGREAMRAEVFGVVGLHARPPADVEAEAVVAMGGDANNPVIVGMRDEATRAAALGEIEADETAAYNSTSRVHLMADGTIEARTHGGTAVALAKASELQALADAFYSHIHAASGSPTTKAIAEFALPNPPGSPLVNPGQPGTETFKGE